MKLLKNSVRYIRASRASAPGKNLIWKLPQILLAGCFAFAVSSNANAAISAMTLTPSEYNIFVFSDGQTFFELTSPLSAKLETTAVACNTGANNVYLPLESATGGVTGRALALLYTAVALERTIVFWVTDVNVPNSNDTCRFHAVRLLPAS